MTAPTAPTPPPEMAPAPAPAPVAPRRRRRRLPYVIAALACVAAIGALVVGGLSRNIVYFRTVSEAIAERADGGDTGRFRLAGEVVDGSVRETADGVEFEVTDGNRTVAVVHRGDPPELFGADVPVVCEGRWGPSDAFESDRIMIRHGNEYAPPNVEQQGGTPEGDAVTTTTGGPA